MRVSADRVWWSVVGRFTSGTLPLPRLKALYRNPGPYAVAGAQRHLARAVKQGDVARVADVLPWARVNAPQPAEGSRSLLHLAVFFGRPEVVACLLACGADVTARDANGATPLHLVCHGSQRVRCAVAGLLLRAGARLDVLDHDGLDPTQRAIKHGEERLVEQLLRWDRGRRHAPAMLYGLGQYQQHGGMQYNGGNGDDGCLARYAA